MSQPKPQRTQDAFRIVEGQVGSLSTGPHCKRLNNLRNFEMLHCRLVTDPWQLSNRRARRIASIFKLTEFSRNHAPPAVTWPCQTQSHVSVPFQKIGVTALGQ